MTMKYLFIEGNETLEYKQKTYHLLYHLKWSTEGQIKFDNRKIIRFLFYCSQNFNLFGFPIFRFWAYLMKVIPETCRDFERTWWRLFQKRVMILSVPDEGYYRNVSWFWAYLMKVIPETRRDFERTWWRLF